ncbi:MAG: prolipoprotein diacylglyceryl transferase [Patescibacteria group bacterium]
MIPWIESHSYSIGPITLQTWGTLVAAGFLFAVWVAARRAKEKKLDPKMVWDVAFWIFLAAFIGARIFHVLFYDPSYYILHPFGAIDPRQPGYAIMGGILGGAGAAYLFAKRKGLQFIEYADVLAWGIPWGCGIGRLGCFLIHDHPGTLTSFALGVTYPDGKVRHDLGLYLSIVGFVIVAIFLIVNWHYGKRVKPGFWFGFFLILDGVFRFCLDFLRVADRHVWLLTPTQWLLIGTTAFGIFLVTRRKN